MIQIDNLSYSLKDKYLVKDVSLSFKPNEISMIIGSNGAGKSTLIKLLSKQLNRVNGDIFINGEDLDQVKRPDFAQWAAVLSQNIGISFPLRVDEIVMMGRYPHFQNKPDKLDFAICSEAIDFFNVRPLLDRNYQTLSGGEKQRVNFARVAAQIWPQSETDHVMKVLFLDEPLTYLDIYYQYEFLEKLKELMAKQSMIVVGVVHDLNLAHKYANKVALLHQGQLLVSGEPDEVFTPKYIREAFRLDLATMDGANGERILSFSPSKMEVLI